MEGQSQLRIVPEMVVLPVICYLDAFQLSFQAL